MGSSLDKLIDINASGLVLLACNAFDIWDPKDIEQHKEWVVAQIKEQMEQDNVGVEALSTIMDEKIELLRHRLETGDFGSTYTPAKKEPQEKFNDFYDPAKKTPAPEPLPCELDKEESKKHKKPKSTDMPTKLAQERKPIKKLIMEDCVQLGLISKKRAEYVITQMAGKQPAEAEKEVVVELRENLHKQVRRLIRKDKDNPWASPKAQEELRLEIVQTPTVRSMLFLTRDILREREEWLKRSHNSITGRIFRGKMSLEK